jgi:adenosylcobinamide-GDP ribazoletransferase
MNGVRHFLLALQFFTRVPVTGRLAGWVGFSPAMLRASAAHFPGVGWLVGAVGAGVFLLAQAGLPGVAGAAVAALLATAATVLLTGAFHEDGLADVADGLGGSADRQRALEIMKDSRIGAFGAIALVLALGLKIALLATLAGQGAMSAATALLGAHVLSRLAPLLLIRWLPYVGDEGASKAKPLADAIGGRALLVGVLYALPAAALLLIAHHPLQGFASLVACLLGALYMAALLRRRLKGFTGDGLGATQQVCELAIYLALAWQA